MISTDDICAIIITYKPNISLVKICDLLTLNNINIKIIDNSPKLLKNEIFNNLSGNIKIHKNYKNLGIAKALNIGCKQAYNENFKFVITLDQDSILLENFLTTLLKVYSEVDKKFKVGVIGSNYYTLNGNKRIDSNLNNDEWIERNYLISSGCLIKLSSLFEIGGFDDNLFIDNVDIDLSLNFRKNGFKLFITKTPIMIHQPGNERIKNILGLNICSSNHEPIRRFYMTRNLIIITKKHFRYFPIFLFKMNILYLIDFMKMILVEKNIKIKIHLTFKGLKSGFLYY